MAARVAPADYDQLHHFVAVGPWDEAPLEAEFLAQANRLVSGPDASQYLHRILKAFPWFW
jgi:hypothetical protein